MSLFQRSPRVVAVTGASAGVGRAIVHRFAADGWNIGLIARDEAALEDVAREVADLGGRAVVAPADVADAAALDIAADRISASFGPVDVWINDAMVTVFSPAWGMTPDEFARVTAVTYLGTVHGAMAALRQMRPRNHGHIIQIGSSLAYRGIPLQSAYCGAKHAIRGFTDVLRAELMHEGSAIRLTMVQLPAVNTPQFDWARTHMPGQPRPVAPVVEPDVIARAVFDVVGRGQREIWIGTSTLKVILGNMLLPGVVDRVLARVAFGGQQTSEPVSPDRADNLYAPVHGLHRTRGRFDAESAHDAPVVSGNLARIAPLVIGAVALLAASRLTRPKPRRLRRPSLSS